MITGTDVAFPNPNVISDIAKQEIADRPTRNEEVVDSYLYHSLFTQIIFIGSTIIMAMADVCIYCGY